MVFLFQWQGLRTVHTDKPVEVSVEGVVEVIFSIFFEFLGISEG